MTKVDKQYLEMAIEDVMSGLCTIDNAVYQWSVGKQLLIAELAKLKENANIDFTSLKIQTRCIDYWT